MLQEITELVVWGDQNSSRANSDVSRLYLYCILPNSIPFPTRASNVICGIVCRSGLMPAPPHLAPSPNKQLRLCRCGNVPGNQRSNGQDSVQRRAQVHPRLPCRCCCLQSRAVAISAALHAACFRTLLLPNSSIIFPSLLLVQGQAHPGRPPPPARYD